MSDVFEYVARSAQGVAVRGALRAASRRDAVAKLRARGLVPSSLGDRRSLRGRWLALLGWGSANAGARAALMRVLAVLISSGTSLTRALSVSAEQCQNPRLREAVEALAGDVASGTTLSDAMRGRPSEFPGLLVAMIHAGEAGGVLDEVLERAATLLERGQAQARQLAAALAYPAFVFASAIGLLLFLVVVTLPGFAGILDQLHGRLPFTTQLLLRASDAVRNPRIDLILAGATAAALFGLARLVRAPSVKRRLDESVLYVPLIGRLVRTSNTAAFARVTGTLLQCGLPLSDALGKAADVCGNRRFRESALTARKLTSEGLALSSALRQERLFDPLFIQLVTAGEESGETDTLLLRLADFLENETAAGIRTLSAVAEPLAILLVGAIVGGTVASILVPLYAAVGNIH